MRAIKLTNKNKDFPSILNNIDSPPKQLFVLGNFINLLAMPRLAIVGSRKVSPYGKLVTEKLAKEVAQQGIVIVSGLAYGVDSIAHRAALAVGTPTIAVLPTSLDEIYPAAHRELAKTIVQQGGALISEYPPGTQPFRTNFLARNRIVSAISDGVLITEAALRSGTLHTAGFALGQGKTVMVVPGNITSPGSEGANNLIKSGAVPITCVDDVITALGLVKAPVNLDLLAANEEEAAIIDCLKQGIQDIGELAAMCQLPAANFNQALTMMEINGKIRALGGGRFGLS